MREKKSGQKINLFLITRSYQNMRCEREQKITPAADNHQISFQPQSLSLGGLTSRRRRHVIAAGMIDRCVARGVHQMAPEVKRRWLVVSRGVSSPARRVGSWLLFLANYDDMCGEKVIKGVIGIAVYCNP